MTSIDPSSPTFLVGSLLIAPILIGLVFRLMSRLGGWHSLALRYATHQIPHGKSFPMRSGRIGSVSYRNCLNVHVARDGLFIGVLSIFRIGHPPLFIPWSAVGAQQNIRILWYKAVRVAIGHPPIVNLELPEQVFAARSAVT